MYFVSPIELLWVSKKVFHNFKSHRRDSFVWWHHRLSKRQPLLPPVMTNMLSWQLLFSVVIFGLEWCSVKCQRINNCLVFSASLINMSSRAIYPRSWLAEEALGQSYDRPSDSDVTLGCWLSGSTLHTKGVTHDAAAKSALLKTTIHIIPKYTSHMQS